MEENPFIKHRIPRVVYEYILSFIELRDISQLLKTNK